MPDRRTHRGPHPDDATLFARECWPALRQAIDDLCWLSDRGYAPVSALKLVGDRYQLAARQRAAVQRCACSSAARQDRLARQVVAAEISGRPLWLDGYNVLTTVEAALAGGVILPGRDGSFRDLASMHGSFRRVAETRPALEHIGRVLAALGVVECLWYLDRPVSNSGRLKKCIEETAAASGWGWRVELVANPDAVLSATDQVVATADSVVLDRCRAWFNLAREVVVRAVPGAAVLEI